MTHAAPRPPKRKICRVRVIPKKTACTNTGGPFLTIIRISNICNQSCCRGNNLQKNIVGVIDLVLAEVLTPLSAMEVASRKDILHKVLINNVQEDTYHEPNA